MFFVLLAYLGFVVCASLWTHYNPFTTCFNVDMFEAHVPGRTPRHYRYPPLTLGRLCFDHKQLVVWWEFREGYSNYYTLTDLTLRGELPYDKHQPQRAPVALALGLNKKSHSLKRSIDQRARNREERGLAEEVEQPTDFEEEYAWQRLVRRLREGQCNGLCGWREIELPLLNRILAHPARYYLSLEGVSEGQPGEIARHKLDQKIKSAI